MRHETAGIETGLSVLTSRVAQPMVTFFIGSFPYFEANNHLNRFFNCWAKNTVQGFVILSFYLVPVLHAVWRGSAEGTDWELAQQAASV